jgi:hypothetical protein
MIEIVNVRGMIPNDPRIVYCGRTFAGWTGGVLQNRFHSVVEANRDMVCEKYRLWLWSQIKGKSGPEWDEIVKLANREIAGDKLILGCWCAPKRCHTESIRKAILWAISEFAKEKAAVV